jgi:hypothetical protein
VRAFISGVLSLAILAGCGDDDEGGDRPPYRSDINVSTDTNVSDLDDDDRQQVCASLDAHVNANVDFEVVARAACLPAAILFGGDQDDCERQLEECVADFPDPLVIAARFEDETVCVSGLSACDEIRVADLDACVNVNLDILYDIFDRLSCGGLSDAERNDAQAAMDTLNVCADVSAACSDFVNVTGPY